MKKILLLLLGGCLTVFSCSESVVDLGASPSTEKVVASFGQESAALAGKLQNYLELEFEEFYVMTGRTATGDIRLNDLISGYNLTDQKIVSSNYDDGKLVLIKNNADESDYLAFFEDNSGNIQHMKRLKIHDGNSEVKIDVCRFDGMEYLTVGLDVDTKEVTILSYNKEVFGETGTRNGCALALGAAGTIWSTAFGMVNPLAGAAVGLTYVVLSAMWC